MYTFLIFVAITFYKNWRKEEEEKKLADLASLHGRSDTKQREKRRKKKKKKKEKETKSREKKGLTAVPSLRERSASCPRSAGWACTLGITGG